MKTRAKVLLTTAVVGVLAFLLGVLVFPVPAAPPASPAVGTSAHVVVGAVEALALGLGVAFAIFGWPRVLGDAGQKGPARYRAFAVCLSVTWLLVSWWIQDVTNRQIGAGPGSLPYVDLGFHVSLMVCAAVLACALLRHDPLLKEVRQMTRIVP